MDTFQQPGLALAMSMTAFAVVLLAAAVHASWNAIVKGGADQVLTTALVAGSAAVIAAFALPFLPAPARPSWPFLAASTLLQLGYFVLMAQAYRLADMSLAYPLMRGAAPLLVALAGTALPGKPLAPGAWLGIGAICAGILGMAALRREGRSRGVRLALLNAAVIAAYTLIDGQGVRLSGAPAAYTLWVSLPAGVSLTTWALVTRRRAWWRYLAGNWALGLAGGCGNIVSYGLALWAMTAAPVAMVAALRETSILFGTAISALVLGERMTPARLGGACLIAAGAIALRLA